MTDDSTRLAVLIDADNTSPKLIKEMFEELASYGTITVKRAYGDWTNPHLNGWREILLGNAISPQQQFAYTSGKNATDSALIIDAMDLLYSGNVEGFAIVSSDSDFTPLATRLRESGKRVIGVGQRKTPKAFVEACEKFVFLEVLTGVDGATEQVRDDQPRAVQSVLTKALNKVDTDDDDWASLSAVTTSTAPIRPSTPAPTVSPSSATWSRRSRSSRPRRSPDQADVGSCGCGSRVVDPSASGCPRRARPRRARPRRKRRRRSRRRRRPRRPRRSAPRGPSDQPVSVRSWTRASCASSHGCTQSAAPCVKCTPS
jgi:uncharacterized protein (TIGR00288 family)